MVRCKNFIDNDYTTILFVNKRAVLATVAAHLEDFKRVLGREITPQLLLSKILATEDIFGGVLKHHQGLIGTLLGYGRHNAWFFHQREEMRPSLLLRFSPKRMQRSASEEELYAINQKLQSFDKRGILDFNPLFLALPSFAADPQAEETQQLKIKYEGQYRKIIRDYRNRDFLEATLERMVKGSAV